MTYTITLCQLTGDYVVTMPYPMDRESFETLDAALEFTGGMF